jgi:hypothetical protein
MSSLKVVYPINNGTLDPIAPADEAQTRDRIEEEWRREMGIRVNGVTDPVLDHRASAAAAAGEKRAEKEKGKGKDESQIGGGGEGVKASRVYTGEELARVYAEACRTREEPGIERLRRFFRVGCPFPSFSHLLLSLALPPSRADEDLYIKNITARRTTRNRCRKCSTSRTSCCPRAPSLPCPTSSRSIGAARNSYSMLAGSTTM